MSYEPKVGADDTPLYDGAWPTLYVGTHFAMQAQLYSANLLVSLVIVAGSKRVLDYDPSRVDFDGTQVILRRNGLSFGRIDDQKRGPWHDDANELEAICMKFDKLWPLHFLAKEWPKELGYGLHTDTRAVV